MQWFWTNILPSNNISDVWGKNNLYLSERDLGKMLMTSCLLLLLWEKGYRFTCPYGSTLSSFSVVFQPNIHIVTNVPHPPLLFIPLLVYASKPRLSFSISKEGDNYHGNVTCLLARGSPPVNFSLLIDNMEIGSVTATGPLTAWFSVNIVPGLDMGVARCTVTTDVQELLSDPVTLVVGMSYTNM